jgi:uncharacterized protein (TIGR03083 family)
VERAEIVSTVERERLDLADLLDDLGPEERTRPSLARGWTVQDVVAHLTLTTRLSPVAAMTGVLTARGDLNRMIGDSARARAAQYTPAELVAQLRETAASARRPLGTRPPDPMVDMLAHGQDIVRPLGRTRGMPAPAVSAALDHVWAAPSTARGNGSPACGCGPPTSSGRPARGTRSADPPATCCCSPRAAPRDSGRSTVRE